MTETMPLMSIKREVPSSQIGEIDGQSELGAALAVLPVQYDFFLSQASFRAPLKIVPSAWHEHAPFAFWLVEKLRPRIFVELGVHNGFSYFAFCQALKMAGLNSAAFGIDLFTGDEHAGFYDESIYQNVYNYSLSNYSDISTIMRSSFHDALTYFEDGTIDLLHIDGRHHYDDVKSDFETWLPKLSERAVVLFHDTNIRERDFGVVRFWSQITKRYPGFNFIHCCGLGVLGVGDAIPVSVAKLLNAAEDEELTAAIRSVYSRLGSMVSLSFRAAESAKALAAKERETDAARESSKREVTALRNEIEKLRSTYAATVEELHSCKKDLAELVDLASIAEESLAEAVEERKSYAAGLAETAAERDALNATLTALRSELDVLGHELRTKGEALLKIEQDYDAIDSARNDALFQIDALHQERDDLYRTINGLREDCSKLTAEHDQAIADAKEEFAIALAAARADAAREFDAFRNDALQQIGALHQERDDLLGTITELRDDRSKLTVEHDQAVADAKEEFAATLAAVRAAAARELNVLHTERESLTRTISVLNDELLERRAEQSNAALEAKLRQDELFNALSAERQRVAEHLDRIAELEQSYERTLREHADGVAGLEAKRRSSEAAGKEVQRENDALKRRLETVLADYEALTADRVSGLAEAAALKAHAEALEISHANALAELMRTQERHLRALREGLIDAEAALYSVKSTSAQRGLGAWFNRGAAHQRKVARTLLQSGLFDVKFYQANYPNVATDLRTNTAQFDIAAAEHYVRVGFSSGFRPNGVFDTRWYLENYEDVRRAGINPLLHYWVYGWLEGRNPGPSFDTNYYLETNPDVRASAVNPLKHYLEFGRYEGRLPVRPV